MSKITITVSGELASGKDTVTEYLVDKYKAKKFGFSDVLRDILDRLYLPQVRLNLGTLAESLRANFGEDVLAKAVIQDIKKAGGDFFVIDGVRKTGELECIKELSSFHFIYVDSVLETRYGRIIKRGENPDDTTKTFEEFVRDNEHASDKTIPQLRKYADSIIDNNGTLDELYTQVDAIIEKLKK